MIMLFEDFLDTGPPEWKSNSSKPPKILDSPINLFFLIIPLNLE